MTKTTTNKDWEERAREEEIIGFNDRGIVELHAASGYCRNCGEEFDSQHLSDLVFGHVGCPKPQGEYIPNNLTPKKLKDFIATELQKARAEAILSAEERGYVKGYQDGGGHMGKIAGETLILREDEKEKVMNNLLREIIEEMPKNINKIEHWGHQIDCYYCIECQEGIDVHPEHLEGFNEALDQVNTILERKLSTVKEK